MKRTLSMIALAVLTLGLLGSCSKINERLDNLDKRIDGIESEQIASINSQISGITSSISDLGQIRSDITSLKQSAENHGEDIFALQEADEAIKDRILNLEDYLDDVLPTFAEKDWVIATFSTLEQYEATCDTIAKIEAKLGTTSEKLSKDIQACADSLTKWVNKMFEGYYTAAQMDAKLTQMKSEIDSARAAGKVTDAKADSIATELTKTKAAVDTAKANIRKEYRAAIDTAIKTSEGKLTKALQDAITEVNGKIESLTTRVGKLETSVADLIGRIIALEKMIQTVAIVPAYSDGSVKVDDKDSLYIDFIVSPASVIANLAKGNVTVLVNKVKTKAFAGVDSIKIGTSDLFEMDATKGTVSVRVSVDGKIPDVTDSTITVAVNVKNGVSNYTTEFVPITLPVSVILDIHSICVPFSTSSRDTTLTATVNNSSKGVTWTSSNTDIATVDAKGKVTIIASVSGKDTIVVTTDEGAKKDTCVVTVQPKGALPGEFTVNASGKKVHFSQGNLQATYNSSASTYTWGFAANQYSYIGDAAGNTSIDSQTNGAVVDLFGWSTSSTNYGISTSKNDNTYTGYFVDWGKAIDGNGTWRTLTYNEWKYLFNNHSNKWVTVNGVNGYVIAPDGFEGTLSETYADDAALAADKLVFLPAAGYRTGSDVASPGSQIQYRASSTNMWDRGSIVDISNMQEMGDDTRGCSVRLIKECQ